MFGKRSVVGLFLSCGLLFSETLTAEPKQLTEQELAGLASKVDKADKLFKSDKYEEALPIYQEAYDLTEEPTMLFSIAQCYRNLGRYQEATDGYRSFLSKTPADNELRPLAQQLLTEVEAKLPKTTGKTPKDTTKPKQAPSLYLFIGAGTAGAAGAGFGVMALLASNGVKAEQKPDGNAGAAAELTQKSKTRALVSDLSFVAAIGLGLGGFVLSKKDNEKTTLLLGPSQVAVSVEF